MLPDERHRKGVAKEGVGLTTGGSGQTKQHARMGLPCKRGKASSGPCFQSAATSSTRSPASISLRALATCAGESIFLRPNFTAAPGILHAGLRPFDNQAPLQLRKYAYHLPHSAARWHGRVDCLSQGLEFDVAGAEVIEHCYQVAQAAAQPVELPDREHIARLQTLETTK